MSAVDVITIRIEENRLLIGAERPLLDFATSGGKKFRSAAHSGHRVKVLPAVLLASENDAILRGPVDYSAASIVRLVRKRILQLRAAVPSFRGVRRFRVRDDDCPRVWAIGRDEIAFRSIARN